MTKKVGMNSQKSETKSNTKKDSLGPPPKIETFNLFPTPVTTFAYNESERIKANVKSLLSRSEVESTMVRNHQSPELKHYFQDEENLVDNKHILQRYPQYFKGLTKFIKISTLFYINEVLGFETPGIYITEAWLNVAGEGAQQYAHNHANSYVSGTYYVEFQPIHHAPLVFNNPRQNGYSHQPYLKQKERKDTEYSVQEWFIKPSEGDLILWPSWMSHGFSTNHEKNRISIAFNALPSRFNNGLYGFNIVPD